MQVHPRIHERHPELSDEDVAYAWEHYVAAATREAAERELRIGFDLKSRELEMVGALTTSGWLVYHAMTPPSRKTRTEIENAKRGA